MINSQRPPTFLFEVQPNHYNQQFSVGDKIIFLFQEDALELKGILLKKYTNSCLVALSQTAELTKRERETYHDRVVVNYKKISGVKMK